jgi:hypothetical protein
VPFLVALALLLLPVGPARASTYCVGSTGCDQDFPSDVQAALNQASTHPGEDTVRIADGFYFTGSGYTYNSPDPVHIEGSGGRNEGLGGPSLADNASPSPSDHTTLKVLGSTASTISGIDVRVAAGNFNHGIETNGSIDNVFVQDALDSAMSQVGVVLDAGGRLTNSTVDVGVMENFSTAVLLTGSATISDSDLVGQSSLRSNTPSTVALVSRTRMRFTSTGAFAGNGVTMRVEDSLLEGYSVGGTTSIAAEVSANGADSALTLNHVTIAGSSRQGSAALGARGDSASHSRLTFRNGVIAGFTDAFFRSAETNSPADITTDWSNYVGTRTTNFGPGTITETNHIDLPPGFLSATDYHLRPDSPLVDFGDPAELAADESATDLSGQPRIADGKGVCTARRDMGAYEFTPGPRAPRVSVSVQPPGYAGGPHSFYAVACDPDGDALTYDWTFDGGEIASGPIVTHTFATPGRHSATLAVMDSTGRRTTATEYLDTPAPPPKFAGVSIAKQTLNVSRQGVAKVKVKCPKTASGSCAGTLKLTAKLRKRVRIGSARFTISAGKTRGVNVKLSRKARAKLRTNGRLNAVATGTSKDASGLTKAGTGTLVLLRPGPPPR